MRKRRIATVVAAAIGAFTLFSTQASAITWEKDFATGLAPSSSGSAVWSFSPQEDGNAAFQKNGDWFFVSDNRADGFSTVAEWRLYNTSGTLVRGGNVWMNLGAGESRWKNKDFTEGYKLQFRVCRGHSDGTFLEHCGSWVSIAA
ncbi:hypothetical protein [Streptomyces sp. NBC_00199]|uniref:hypothetical protein n=1 Tax=Streptomyces sp. NBC_00199 TaxID=2975678 RepID=UPI00224C88A5|nr:hypothetical protein [Streptomyces sp. NBC_00199]MCX5265469.1 hypothetical protein [Streptomyces sp. NBC_00199]